MRNNRLPYFGGAAILVFPAKIRTTTTPLTSKYDKMPNLDRISEAIADLDTQAAPNIRSTAIKYGLCPKTLENRWKGKSVSMKEAVSMYRQALTNAQENLLIGIINRLTERRMPLTFVIVINLAKKIRGAFVRKN